MKNNNVKLPAAVVAIFAHKAEEDWVDTMGVQHPNDYGIEYNDMLDALEAVASKHAGNYMPRLNLKAELLEVAQEFTYISLEKRESLCSEIAAAL